MPQKKQIKIRRMTAEDVPAVAEIERESFSQPWSEKAYLDTVSDKNALYLVAEREGGGLAGMCGLFDLQGEGDISNVAVAKDFRGQKIGETMLRELLRQGNERGIASFTLEVRASNEVAIHLYEKLGFISEGRRKNFYERPKEDALILWKRKD